MATGGGISTQHFVRVSDIVKEPQMMLMPISGYEDMPLVSLEDAVEPLVSILPRIRDYVYVAKQRCKPVPADGLTRDESSSIMLYSMEWEPEEKCLYFALNSTLRSEDRRKLKPWFSYLKLFLNALCQLPSTRCFVYRGVKMDLSEQYPKGKTFIWWAFSSCASSVETLENQQYLGKTGERTLFTIDCDSGKDISRHSYYQLEEEILLLAARQFRVKSCFQPAPNLHMIQLTEVEPPICLLQTVTVNPDSKKPSPVSSNKPIPSKTVGRVVQKKETVLKPNKNCRPDREINILLLGQTGIGKSTFINAFANYITNDTLAEAVNDEMQVVIPSSFSYTTQDPFDERTITIGNENEHEKFIDVGQSNTQHCRSFIFPIGDRNLRLIDTPGIGDTRGLQQDTKNFQEILTYIAQYEHLNGVCILLKPNEERLTILFRFSVNELLRHLHVNASENIIFVFTNSRSTFFMPGATRRLLGDMLDKHRKEHNVNVPFSMDNTFLLDNEPFRYLALRRNGIQLDNDQTVSYTKSWDQSVKEYARLMSHIVTRPLHAVRDTLSLNDAEQLIRKLPRPIAETVKLIEENIQLAKEHKKKVLKNPEIASEGIPQNNALVVSLRHPRLVCAGEKCCRVIEMGKETKVEYLCICHDECYLEGFVQETLAGLELKECEAMNEEGFCTVCGCPWLQHKHITYEFKITHIHLQSGTTDKSSSNKQMSLSDIDKRIQDLRNEAAKIQDVYRKLAEFLHANAILPTNDEIVAYLEYFIREERMKQSAGARNTEVIAGLEKIMTEFSSHMELFKKTLKKSEESVNMIDIIQPEETFPLIGILYRLPITGQQIREQVNGIKVSQEKSSGRTELFVELPAKAASSKLMIQLKDIFPAISEYW